MKLTPILKTGQTPVNFSVPMANPLLPSFLLCQAFLLSRAKGPISLDDSVRIPFDLSTRFKPLRRHLAAVRCHGQELFGVRLSSYQKRAEAYTDVNAATLYIVSDRFGIV